ncbi:MAG: DUF4372 domain-containing protein [Opitutus sp.]|nr:DUF4372 domain-containing protein [Opitutus sp.]
MRQLVELIPAYLVPKLAREHDGDAQARTFSPWSHVVALLYAQLSHALSLNDVCDGLRLCLTPLRALRGATPPSRNALSHANKIRGCTMAEQLFWRVREHLQASYPVFVRGHSGSGLAVPAGDSCRRCYGHPTGRFVPGLGGAQPSQGGREMPYASVAAQPAAGLCGGGFGP